MTSREGAIRAADAWFDAGRFLHELRARIVRQGPAIMTRSSHDAGGPA
jgi:hypothetical protein